jgi:hypothetical protein
VDRHLFHDDPDPDPNLHVDADPDPDPDWYLNDADLHELIFFVSVEFSVF